jgi:hypothetical protein
MNTIRPIKQNSINSTEDDYTAAYDYLNLIMVSDLAVWTVKKLKLASTMQMKVSVIIRAAGLSAEKVDEHYLRIDPTKNTGDISPVLLVRDTIQSKVIIADGFERLCMSFHKHPDGLILCKIV